MKIELEVEVGGDLAYIACTEKLSEWMVNVSDGLTEVMSYKPRYVSSLASSLSRKAEPFTF